MTNRHEAARKQEEAWLDLSLAELAELSHAAAADAGNSPADDDSATDTEIEDSAPDLRTAGTPRQDEETSSAKANRDDALDNRHGK